MCGGKGVFNEKTLILERWRWRCWVRRVQWETFNSRNVEVWRKKGFHFQLCLLPCRQKAGWAKRDVYKVELGKGESHWLSACQGRDQNMCVYRDILSPGWHHSFSLHPTFPPNIHFEYHCLVQGGFCNAENIFFDVKKWKTMLGNIQIF